MRNWFFILIFSTLLGNMSAHQVQLVTYHQKTNGILIRIVVSNTPDVNNIAGWVGQENWFYLTLNEASRIGKNVKFEPEIALFAPLEDPILYYKEIVKFSKLNLNKNGFIYFEINPIYIKEIKQSVNY